MILSIIGSATVPEDFEMFLNWAIKSLMATFEVGKFYCAELTIRALMF